MAGSTRTFSLGLASCCAVTLLAGCIRIPPPLTTAPSQVDGASLIANNAGSLISNAGADLQNRALSGQLTIPDATLISNNAGALTGVAGGAFYALSRSTLGLDTLPLANALVSLVTPDGTMVSSGSVRTDAQGRYSFSQVPQIAGPLLVQADFTANNSGFSFKTLVPTLAATATIADIDVASTLVAEKARTLISRGVLTAGALPTEQVQLLTGQVRQVMVPGLVPFMARTSRDIVPTFDQLSLDNPAIMQAAASIAPSVAAPVETWLVSTRYRRSDVQALTSPLVQFWGFEADKSGNLYFYEPVSGSPTVLSRIWKVSPAGAASIVAELPISPASIAAAPDGSLYVVGIQPSTAKVLVCHVVGSTVSILPGYLARLNDGVFNEAPYGRLAIDDAGNLYAAYRRQHVIMRLASGSVVPEIFAGTPLQQGYVDGKGGAARFNSPMSPVRGPDGAIYVADSGNNCIRRIALDGTVSTYAGKQNDSSYRSGRGAYARFGQPNTLVLDAEGNCLISDSHSLRVRRISPDGSVFLIAGSGASGSMDGLSPSATFNSPEYLALDGQGRIYVLDRDNASPSVPLIRVISRQ